MPRRKRTKNGRKKEENRNLSEFAYEVSQRKEVIEREYMGSGSKRE